MQFSINKLAFAVTFVLSFVAINRVAQADRDITIEVYVVSGANTPVAGATIVYNTWHDATYRRVKADMSGKVVLRAKYTLRIFGVYAEGCQKIENNNDFWQPNHGKDIRANKIYRLTCQSNKPAYRPPTTSAQSDLPATWADRAISECKYYQNKFNQGDMPNCQVLSGGDNNAFHCCCKACDRMYYDANNSPNPDYRRSGELLKNCQVGCTAKYLR